MDNGFPSSCARRAHSEVGARFQTDVHAARVSNGPDSPVSQAEPTQCGVDLQAWPGLHLDEGEAGRDQHSGVRLQRQVLRTQILPNARHSAPAARLHRCRRVAHAAREALRAHPRACEREHGNGQVEHRMVRAALICKFGSP